MFHSFRLRLHRLIIIACYFGSWFRERFISCEDSRPQKKSFVREYQNEEKLREIRQKNLSDRQGGLVESGHVHFFSPSLPSLPSLMHSLCTVALMSSYYFIADMFSDVMWYSGQSYPAIYRATRGLGLVKRLRCSYVFKQKYSFKGVGISGKFDQYFPVTDLRKTCC